MARLRNTLADLQRPLPDN